MRRERRVAERCRARLAVEFRCESLGGEGSMLDVSLAGARIEQVTTRPPPGVELQLLLRLPQSTSAVELSAQVVRHTETGGFAVRFHKLDVGALRTLRSALSRVEELSMKGE